VERRDFRPRRIFATFFSHLSTTRAQQTAVTVCRFYIDEQARTKSLAKKKSIFQREVAGRFFRAGIPRHGESDLISRHRYFVAEFPPPAY